MDYEVVRMSLVVARSVEIKFDAYKHLHFTVMRDKQPHTVLSDTDGAAIANFQIEHSSCTTVSKMFGNEAIWLHVSEVIRIAAM